MVDDRELQRLITELESDRVERTISTKDSEKFCEAICAFANDMPGNGKPGYLILGVRDADGAVVGIEVTDALLQQFANYADSGQIVPLPSLNVQEKNIDGRKVVVVEVFPSDIPPVRYRGRVFIRRGSRKAIANEQEERILTERRTHDARSFDLRPCKGCGKDELVLDLFQLTYRRKAVAPEILEENHRDLFLQMASLGLWATSDECATNAGAILFAENPTKWFPGAAIQYVHYQGDGLDSDVLDERRFEGDLISVLRELDAFLKTLFPAHPEFVSHLREEIRSPYPVLAIRELLMNAVMHRDYQSNAAIRFYRFAHRIEIQNPGGLYGAVTVQSFPNQNDYRNPKIAEAMKVLGYVNRFGRGIAQAQAALRDNGNPPALFDVGQPTYFLATIEERGS